jgi:hypothetical protein
MNTQIQIRVVHCKREPYDIYIGRPNRGLPGSKWHNPFRIGPDGLPTRVERKDSRLLV